MITRFDEFDDEAHPFRKWWNGHGQYMLSGGGRRESIWAARGWIAREQLACGVPVTGDSLRETRSAPVQTGEGTLWCVVRGDEGDSWGISRQDTPAPFMDIAQMMDEEDAKEVVQLHNASLVQTGEGSTMRSGKMLDRMEQDFAAQSWGGSTRLTGDHFLKLFVEAGNILPFSDVQRVVILAAMAAFAQYRMSENSAGASLRERSEDLASQLKAAQQELGEIRNELVQCDDIKLDQPLFGIVNDLQVDRESLRAQMESWRERFEAAETLVGELRTQLKTALEDAKGWKQEYEMYRNAWSHEMGGLIRPKSHDIDGFVLRTRDLYEALKDIANMGETTPIRIPKMLAAAAVEAHFKTQEKLSEELKAVARAEELLVRTLKKEDGKDE